MSLDQQFNTITDKLQQLLKQQKHLQKKNEQLRAELEAAKQKEATANKQVHELQRQIAILKLAAGDMNSKDKKEFEKQLNRYIREIDKCIALLSQ